MIEPKVGFIVYGVHKDGLKDPMGQPFIDEALVARAEDALNKAGLKLIRHPVVIASKEEAITALRKMKHEESVDAVILFSGTWVWAAHLVGAIRDYAAHRERRVALDASGLAGLAASRWASHARRTTGNRNASQVRLWRRR